MRRLQEWMGHRDLKATLAYADYQPDEREADMVERAFAANARPSHDRATDRRGRPDQGPGRGTPGQACRVM